LEALPKVVPVSGNSHHRFTSSTRMNYYKATWGITLTLTSLLCTVLFLAAIISLIRAGGFIAWVIGLPVLLLLITPLYSVKGYTVTQDSILIHRPFWKTKLFLTGLESIEVMPVAMSWSIRTMGNGGCFSITGYYRNKKLGRYR